MTQTFTFVLLVVVQIVNAVYTIEIPCNAQADCLADQCCVSNVPIKGRRFSASGHCVTMGNTGDSCYASTNQMNHNPPQHMTHTCPCASGLYCFGSGIHEVPLGEKGTCVSIKK